MNYDPKKPFTEDIFSMIQETWSRSGPLRVKRVGNNSVVIKNPSYWSDYDEPDGIDTIGSKGLIHYQMRTFDYAAQDAAAMVFNDLARRGAKPYRMQDFILLEKEDIPAIYELTKGFVGIAKAYGVAITGGETAIVNTIRGMEVGVAAVGKVRKGELVVPKIRKGDDVIGVKSSGIHSNGLTLARKKLDELGLKLEDELYPTVTIGHELTRPTKIYVRQIQRVLQTNRDGVHGLSHITGGAFTKLKELTGKKYDINIRRDHSLKPHYIFSFLKEKGNLSNEEMYETFNNGIGFVIIADPKKSNDILQVIKPSYSSDIIGTVEKGNGTIRIESQFSNKTVEL